MLFHLYARLSIVADFIGTDGMFRVVGDRRYVPDVSIFVIEEVSLRTDTVLNSRRPTPRIYILVSVQTFRISHAVTDISCFIRFRRIRTERVVSGIPAVGHAGARVAHVQHVVARVHVVRALAATGPAEVRLHLVLMAPLVAQAPDGVVVVIHQPLAVQHAALLVYMERNATASLEHIVCKVHVSKRGVLRHAVILVEAEQLVLPSHQRIQEVDILDVTERRSVAGLAIVAQTALISGHTLGRPYGMGFLSDHVHAIVGRSIAKGPHLFVRLVGGEISVHLLVHKVYLDIGILLGIVLRIIANVSKSVVIAVILDDVHAVVQLIVCLLRIASIKIAANLTYIPGNDGQTDRNAVGYARNDDSMLALGNIYTRNTFQLVVKLTGGGPLCRKHVRIQICLVGGVAVIERIRIFIKLRGQRLDERVLQSVDICLRHAFAQRCQHIIAEDGPFGIVFTRYIFSRLVAGLRQRQRFTQSILVVGEYDLCRTCIGREVLVQMDVNLAVIALAHLYPAALGRHVVRNVGRYVVTNRTLAVAGCLLMGSDDQG